MPVPDEIKALCTAVPAPPDESLPGPTTAAQIAAAEAALGFSFPSEWREFLLFQNGPCIGPGGIFGVDTARPSLDLVPILAFYPEWKAQRWLPIAGDGCGNYYVLVLQGEGPLPVCFLDAGEATNVLAYCVASDLWHFLTFLLRKELGERGWPFDERYVLNHDLALAHCLAAPLPWQA